MDFATIVSLTSASATTSSSTANRPFTVAFVLTLFGYLIYQSQQAVARAEASILNPGLSNISGLNLPVWMLSEMFLLALGLLMAAEWYTEQHEDLRPMLEDLKTNLVKPGVNAAMQFGLIQGQGTLVLEVLAQRLPGETLLWLASLGPGVAVASTNASVVHEQAVLVGALGWLVTVVAVVWAAVTSVGTWLLAGVRQAVMDMLTDFDEDDSLGLIKMLSFAEGGWTITLMLTLIFLPLIALALTGVALLGLFLVKRWFEQRTERTKVPCAHCQSAIYPTALFCPSCRQPNESPRQVGVFGQARTLIATDRSAQRLRLLARKRCPSCATRLPAKTLRQSCPACSTVTFGDISEANVYLRSLDKKLPQTLVICGLLGFVPLVGLVPGIIYYRLSLVASLRAYIPRTVGCFTRWGLRLAAGVLIMLQPFFLGWLTLPAMALMNYVVYRQVLRSGLGGLAQPMSAVGAPTGMQMAPAGGMAAMPIPATPPPAALAPVINSAASPTEPVAAAAPAPAEPVATAAPAPEAPAAQACPTCRTTNPPNYRFCASCGTAISEA